MAQHPTFTLRQLLEAGVHFGHQTHRWNPLMEQYIHTKKNGVHIIDLTQTVPLLDVALARISKIVSSGGRVLFVGTKRQAQLPIKDAATRSSQYYINHRWLGGTLTNWKTVSNSINRLKSIEEKLEQGVEGLTKKERLGMEREHAKLLASLGGIREMDGLPEILFVIDVKKESLAIAEANKLSIPVVAVVDTNCSPNGVDYIIPGNDDASRSVALYCDLVAQAAIVGIEQQMGKIGVGIGEIAEELGVTETMDESQVEGGEGNAAASASAAGETDSKAAAPEQEGGADDSEQLETAAGEADAATSEIEAKADAGKPDSNGDQSVSDAPTPEQEGGADDSEQPETAAGEADAATPEIEAKADAGKPDSNGDQSVSDAPTPEQGNADDSQQLETAADEADAATPENEANADAGKPDSNGGKSDSDAPAPEQEGSADDSKQLETTADEADAATSEKEANSDSDSDESRTSEAA